LLLQHEVEPRRGRSAISAQTNGPQCVMYNVTIFTVCLLALVLLPLRSQL
jgi:hypothetical protein